MGCAELSSAFIEKNSERVDTSQSRCRSNYTSECKKNRSAAPQYAHDCMVQQKVARGLDAASATVSSGATRPFEPNGSKWLCDSSLTPEQWGSKAVCHFNISFRACGEDVVCIFFEDDLNTKIEVSCAWKPDVCDFLRPERRCLK